MLACSLPTLAQLNKQYMMYKQQWTFVYSPFKLWLSWKNTGCWCTLFLHWLSWNKPDLMLVYSLPTLWPAETNIWRWCTLFSNTGSAETNIWCWCQLKNMSFFKIMLQKWGVFFVVVVVVSACHVLRPHADTPSGRKHNLLTSFVTQQTRFSSKTKKHYFADFKKNADWLQGWRQ